MEWIKNFNFEKQHKIIIFIINFFYYTNFNCHIIDALCKRNDQLKVFKTAKIAHMIDIDDLKTDRGFNHIGLYKDMEILIGVPILYQFLD